MLYKYESDRNTRRYRRPDGYDPVGQNRRDYNCGYQKRRKDGTLEYGCEAYVRTFYMRAFTG